MTDRDLTRCDWRRDDQGNVTGSTDCTDVSGFRHGAARGSAQGETAHADTLVAKANQMARVHLTEDAANPRPKWAR